MLLRLAVGLFAVLMCALTATAAPRLKITTKAPLPGGTTGKFYSLQFTATGGTLPYSWSLTGKLPGGLTFSASGLLSGTVASTAAAPGTYAIVVIVRDSGGHRAKRRVALDLADDERRNGGSAAADGQPDVSNRPHA